MNSSSLRSTVASPCSRRPTLSVASRGYAPRFFLTLGVWLGAVAALVSVVSCETEESGPEYLKPVSDCTSVDQCFAADSRYDACQYVCAGDVTYCNVSCEVSSDCFGRGLPDDYVYCNVPRDGEGFCASYDYDYQPGDCVEDPGPVSDSGGSNDDSSCYSSCVDACLEAGGTNCSSDCADIC